MLQVARITSDPANSDGTYTVNTAGRPADRQRLGVMGNTQVANGDRAIILGSARGDIPMIFGQSTWLIG
jgi:hypothetical protein